MRFIAVFYCIFVFNIYVMIIFNMLHFIVCIFSCNYTNVRQQILQSVVIKSKSSQVQYSFTGFHRKLYKLCFLSS